SLKDDDEKSPSYKLAHFLHTPVAFVIFRIVARANAAVVIGHDWAHSLASTNSIGIAAGLIVGKPLGVTLLCYAAVASGLCRLPLDLKWRDVGRGGGPGGCGI